MLRNVACPVRRGAVGKGPDSILVPRQRPTLHLYHLPQVWARGTGDSKNFRFENPQRVIDEMRHNYELAQRRFRAAPTHAASTPVRTDLPPDSRRSAQPAPARPTTPEYAQKRATARAALEHAERRTGLAHERRPRS